MHWAAKYVGLPYGEGARGPDKFDCWGSLQLIYLQEQDIILPELAGLSAHDLKSIHEAIVREAHNDWLEIVTPTDGCIVAMSAQKIMHHVGIYCDIDGGKVLHSRPGQNMVADTLRGLRLKGLNVLKYYQHKQWKH